MVETTIVVRAFNEERHIARLLEGLCEQTYQDYEVVVVDSGSTDATVDIAKTFGARIVHIAPSDFTFGRSLNLGCEAAQGQYLVFASAHVYPVYPDWLALLRAPFDDPSVALVYGRQSGSNTTRFSEQQLFSAWFPQMSDFRQNHPFANNANAAIRRDTWVERPYDESLSGLEDLDWAQWALDHAYNIAYEARAEVVHVHDETSAQILHRYEREAMALKRIYPSEHMSALEMMQLIARNIFADVRAARANGVLRDVVTGIITFRSLQFFGAYRGLNRPPLLTRQLRQKFYYPSGIHAKTSRRKDVSPIAYASSMTLKSEEA